MNNLLLEISDAVATVTVNRPDKLNALNRETVSELFEVFARLGADDSVRAIVLTGAGEKAFVAGADITEINQLKPVDATEFGRRGQRLMSTIENLGKPVIAAVNGFALGGGCELAMACTLRIASESARIGLPEINLGILPGYGGTQRLPRLVGKGLALEMALSGKPVDAARAYEIGLVNRVVEGDELLAQAGKLAASLAGNAPIATRHILRAINEGTESSLERGLDIEAQLFGLCCSTDDMVEGTSAFMEKRKPSFTGR
ncbi:MAG: enoyl-CoA hydratase-related protein [Xanthomonadales bacterium]|nr:enoyl-CoA hydratase-related protein [Xanthomonadales bacterium]